MIFMRVPNFSVTKFLAAQISQAPNEIGDHFSTKRCKTLSKYAFFWDVENVEDEQSESDEDVENDEAEEEDDNDEVENDKAEQKGRSYLILEV